MPTIIRLLKRLLYTLIGFITAVFIVWAFMARSLPDLELWHTVELESEFQADDAARIKTFEDYMMFA